MNKEFFRKEIGRVGKLVACILSIAMVLSCAHAEAPVNSVQAPDDVVFWLDGDANLKMETLADGEQSVTWPEAPGAAYYYLVVCQKGFLQSDPNAKDNGQAWNATLWDTHANINDVTEKMLAIIGEYDASLWCRSDTNTFQYAQSDVLTTLVYAQNNIPFEMIDAQIVPAASAPTLASTLENLFVFYVKEGATEPAAVPTVETTAAPTVETTEAPTVEPTTAPTAETTSTLPATPEAPEETKTAETQGAQTTEVPATDNDTLQFIGFAIVTNKGNVNLRKGDHVDFPVVERVGEGTFLPCLAITERGWYAVLSPNLEVVYVAPGLVEFTPSDE